MPLKGRFDFRSDTFTEPTVAMREAMMHCEVGDDVWGTDETVIELQLEAARVTGKEASIFLPSGTMGNLAAIMSHTTGRGEELLCGDRAHISLYEQGSCSTIAGVHARTVRNNDDGTFDLAELTRKIRNHSDSHFPKTSVVCIENTHNMCNGSPISAEFTAAVLEICKPLGIKLHIDGARIFNAATSLNVNVSDLVKDADSVTFCLSKGLASPIGSLLCGSKEFIAKAHRARKALGGGMRQAGVIASCGLISLRVMSLRLHEDHSNAKKLSEELGALPGVIAAPAPTNIVKFSLDPTVYPMLSKNLQTVVEALKVGNVYMSVVDEGRSIRAVTHYHITPADILSTISEVSTYLNVNRWK